MNSSSLNVLKKELKLLENDQLLEVCLSLVKFKKENKEFLHFLLFESQNLDEYVAKIKEIVDVGFQELNRSNFYLVNKGIRKLLRSTNKYIKYASNKSVEVQLLLYFCEKLKKSGIKLNQSTSLFNLYNVLIIKIEKGMSKLHEDLQFDYQLELDKLAV